jgi:methyl-accepting chemotaxis protein
MLWLKPSSARPSAKGRPAAAYPLPELKADIADKVSVAVMMVDRDFTVTYVNGPTMELFKKNASTFRSVWPTFEPDKILGMCIDAFHKNPARQRELLSDPSKLPFKTDITIGDLKVQLLVSGSFDRKGNYVGNVLEWQDVTAIRMNAGMLAAIDKAQAVIEFTLDGKIVHANENFLNALGYTLDEVRGQHHSMFVDPAYRQSPEYRMFWEKLGRGEFDADQYKRIGKGGKEVWIQASYNPILDANGKPFKVVKYATDVTAQVRASQALQLAVRQTEGVVSAAKENDLTRRIPLAGKTGEIESLCAGVNGLIDTMAEVVSGIKSATREVTNASAEISTSTTDLSQRTEEQAASLEETSASMEEISATVKKNAENAEQASHFAAETREVAERGGAVVSDAVGAMARIEESSRKISDIIGVIDEIARQTNLLALNAAVEAARAGDAGRGFAVVATEVRSLAQRSSQAAKDIKDLITSSSSQVKDGVDLVNRAGTSLTEIVTSIKKVAGIVSDIAAASAEQATGLDQVNKALAQMDEVTQQNSALVEENAATAKNLESQAAAMDERVGVFILDDAGAAEGSRSAGSHDASKIRTPAPKVVAANPRARPARAAAAKTAAAVKRGPARQMQTALATALKGEPDWKEF